MDEDELTDTLMVKNPDEVVPIMTAAVKAGCKFEATPSASDGIWFLRFPSFGKRDQIVRSALAAM
jgi:hypothetical protein